MIRIEELSDDYLKLLEDYIELKKAYNQYEHILNVSIRQAKNKDVFFNLINNLLKFLEKSIDFIYEFYKIKGVIKGETNNYFLKIKELQKLEPELSHIFEFYQKLKIIFINIQKNNYVIKNEFKRTIKIEIIVGKEKMEINIPILKEQNYKLQTLWCKINEILKYLKMIKNN